jgi:catalase
MSGARALGTTELANGIAAVERLQLGMMQGTGLGRRGQHFKAHGCIVARFEVLDNIPPRYKVGLFARPAKYTAYIRYSNATQDDDRKPDMHGMAIKLTGVPGSKVLPAESTATTHDFLLADNPVFFIRTADEYVRFMQDFAVAEPQGKPPLQFLAWLKANHPEDIPVVAASRQQVRDSPLSTEYWSQVPYAFGLGERSICRYNVQPGKGNVREPIPAAARDGDYLHRALAAHLSAARKGASFDFMVQLRDDATPEVINNPTLRWEGPLQRVARITIRPQKFDSPAQLRFGEDLSYTPWHALPEHRPVGEIGEVRRSVYVASSALRHQTNGRPSVEPRGTEHREFNRSRPPRA